MSPPASLLPSFLVSLLLVSLLAAPAAALSIQFQDSGLGRNRSTFSARRRYIRTTNTSSVLK